jgi:hypothetical protein
MLEQLQDADALDRSRAALDSASLPKKMPYDGAEPDKPATKRHLVVDVHGTPLNLTLTEASCRDSRMWDATLIL